MAAVRRLGRVARENVWPVCRARRWTVGPASANSPMAVAPSWTGNANSQSRMSGTSGPRSMALDALTACASRTAPRLAAFR